jgi:hypothetical protein
MDFEITNKGLGLIAALCIGAIAVFALKLSGAI